MRRWGIGLGTVTVILSSVLLFWFLLDTQVVQPPSTPRVELIDNSDPNVGACRHVGIHTDSFSRTFH